MDAIGMSGGGLLLLSGAMACAVGTKTAARPADAGRVSGPLTGTRVSDPHSFSNPNEIRVRDLALELDVRFDRRVLSGSAVLSVERRTPDSRVLVLDTRGLTIAGVDASDGSSSFVGARFTVGTAAPILGAPLRIELPDGATRVRVRYETGPGASALQWLAPEQTAGRVRPYLFTQSEAIHARSWIPLQDTPAVRQSYSAAIRVPPGLTALMSAAREERGADGAFRFRMPQAIPSYLIALAVGDVAFAPLGRRAGVWSEPSVLPVAASEFADTEAMIEAAEALFGPYRWDRYELLVLPPSFPYGGMENPRLTFATPTLLAGDRSLVDVVAHELAHSWSGNLVTNATWSDFWLNEGFTTYCERRIVERVFGAERAEMEWVLGRQTLDDLGRTLPARDQTLRPDLAGRDPDEVASELAYEKGALLLRTIEKSVGRERFDPFLRSWFDGFAFQSVTSPDLVRFLTERLFAGRLPADLDLEGWLSRSGVPAGAAPAHSAAFDRVDAARSEWLAGGRDAASLPARRWSTLEWLRFLRGLPENLSNEKASELDRAFALSEAGNSEITFQWLLISVRSGFASGQARLERFLTSMGRRKFLKPLYEALAKTSGGRERALAIYRRARPGYHPIAVETVDRILSWKP